MAVFALESLVLRGVSVRCGGQAGELRLGTGFAVNPQTPEINTSMRHPPSGYARDLKPADRPDHTDRFRVVSTVSGTGRSPRRAGVLCRRSPAISAGRTILLGWSSTWGGPKPAAAARLRTCSLAGTRLVASVGEVAPAPRRSVSESVSAFTGRGSQPKACTAGQRSTETLVWCKPASRTPSASTRGKGDR